MKHGRLGSPAGVPSLSFRKEAGPRLNIQQMMNELSIRRQSPFDDSGNHALAKAGLPAIASATADGVGGLISVTVHSGANAGTFFCSYDGNGNVSALVKASDGSVAARYEYGPFGEVIRATGSMAKVNPFRFSTKYQDDETDLLYYGYRYYNASVGRWLSRDPIHERGGKNLNRFVRNDPLRHIDALGLLPNWIRKCAKVIAGSGKVCVSANCQGKDLSGFTYLAEKEPPEKPGEGEGAKKPRELPSPGQCVDADALYQPGGAYKIKDGQLITVDCSSGSPEATGHTDIFWKSGDPEPPVTDWPDRNIPPYPSAPPVEPSPPVNPWEPAPPVGRPGPF